MRNKEKFAHRVTWPTLERAPLGGETVRGYYTLREASEMLGIPEDEVLHMINVHLIPRSLLRVDRGVLVGRDGLKRLSRLLRSEHRSSRRFRSRLEQEKPCESWADSLASRAAVEAGEIAGQQHENRRKAGPATEWDGEQPSSRPWYEYPWPLSEWVRLTGKKPGHLPEN